VYIGNSYLLSKLNPNKIKLVFIIFFISFLFSLITINANAQNIVSADYEYKDPFVEKLEGKPIGQIKYQGLSEKHKNIVESTITYLGAPGDAFSYEKAKEVFHNLYDLGYFEDIKIDGIIKDDKVILTFIFVELPVIEEIYFEGLEEIDKDDLLEKMTMQIEKNFKPLYVEQDIDAIIALYRSKGIVGTKVDIEVRTTNENKILVYVTIHEGEEIYIEDIKITGTRQLDPNNILDIMETSARTFYHSDAIYDETKLESDLDKIVLYCQERGYFKAKIVDYSVKIDFVYPDEKEEYPEKGYFITIKIEEGDQYYMGKVHIKGNTIFSKEKLLESFEQVEGEVYNHSIFLTDIQKVKNLYQNRGYANANVTFIESINEARKIIDFDVNIYESQKVHIENIYIRGNDKTKTYVIDRELKITEGSPLNFELIRQSGRNLINTGYIKNLLPDTRQSSEEGLIDLILRVQEQRTGIFTMGAGYGSSSGITVFEEVKETNFLGYGWSIAERIDYGERNQNYQLSSETRWLLPYKPIYFRIAIAYELSEFLLSRYDLREGLLYGSDSLLNGDLNGDGIYDRRDYVLGRGRETPGTDEDYSAPEFASVGPAINYSDVTYLTRGVSFSLAWGYRFFNDWNFIIRDRVFYFITEDIRSGDLLFNKQDIEMLLSDDSIVKSDLNSSWQLQNSILFGLDWDRRDLFLNTSEGFKIAQYFEYTGGFVGDKHHLRLQTKFSAYYSPFRRENGDPWFVLAVYANAEVLYPQFNDKNHKIDVEEIYSGEVLWFDGVNELRGWTTFNRNELRGFAKGSYSGEIRLPIPGINQIISGVFFFDAGNMINDPSGGYKNLPLPWLQYFYDTPIYNQKTGKKLNRVETYEHLGRLGDVGFKYSWGFGFRIEIPMLPIRLYFAQKGRQLSDESGHWVQWDKGFETVLSVAGFF